MLIGDGKEMAKTVVLHDLPEPGRRPDRGDARPVLEARSLG